MFDAVLNRHKSGPSRFGRGMLITVGAHVAALIVVVWASHRAGSVVNEIGTDVRFVAPAPPPPPPPPPPAGGGAMEAPKTDKPKVQPKKDVVVESKKREPTPEPEQKPSDDSSKGESGGVAGGVPGGVAGGVVGGQVGGVVGGTLGGQVGGTGSTEIVPFGEGMTRPPPLDPDEIQYTSEARAARASGVMIVRCTIQKDGSVTNCRVLKSVPAMEQAVLSALQRHRTPPILFQGRPVSVDYTYTIRLKLPN